MKKNKELQLIPKDLLAEIFEHVFEWSQDAIAIVSEDGYILWVNQMFETLTDCKRALALGSKLENFIGEDFRVNLMENILDIAKMGIAWRVVGKKSNGVEHDVVLSARVVRSSGVPFVILTHRAEAEDKIIEEWSVKTHNQANLELLIGGIAHEFINILTGIHSYSELTLASINSNNLESTKYYIEKLGYTAMRGVEWSKKILPAISDNKLTSHREVDINEAVLSVVEFMKLTIPSNINIRLELKHNNSRIIGNVFQIEQALMNLLTNAGNAIPAGGEIIVKTYNRSKDDKDYLVISVSDTGLGISQDIQSKIYKPFFTTKSSNGTGLGLYIVSLVMKNHNGFIDLKSEVGKGSKFELNFPISK